MGLTSHFIDACDYKSINLGVLELNTNHTALNIQEWLEQMLNTWNIDKNKVCIAVADNAANITKAVKDCFGEDKYLPCLAHTLNLVVNGVLDNEKDFKEIFEVIHKVKSIVTYFHQSCTAMDLLRKLTPLKLIQSNNTRWHSVFEVLERYLLIKDNVAQILIKLAGDKVPSPLMGEDLTTITELMMMLKPFKEVSNILCGEKYTTGSEALPLIKNLKMFLDNMQASTSLSIKIKRALQEKFDKKFKNMALMLPLSVANLLDPRYKKLYFHSEATAYSNAVQKISSLLNELKKQTEEPANTVKNDARNLESQDVQETGLWTLDTILRSQFQKNEINACSALKPGSSMPIELSHYLSQKIAAKEDNPIMYWVKQPDSPLAKIALKYLTVVATSVPSERQFSHAAKVLRDDRSSLSPEHFQELLFMSTLPTEYWKLANII